MKDVKSLKEKVEDLLDTYLEYGTEKTIEKIEEMGIYNNEMEEILSYCSIYDSLFNNLECDAEGFNKEQEKIANDIYKYHTVAIMEYMLTISDYNNDIDYVTFVLGVEILKIMEDEAMDDYFERCKEIAILFLGSTEYEDRTKSTYDVLHEYIKNNKLYIVKTEYYIELDPMYDRQGLIDLLVYNLEWYAEDTGNMSELEIIKDIDSISTEEIINEIQEFKYEVEEINSIYKEEN